MIFSRRFDAEASSRKRMRSSSTTPPSFLLFLLLLLELAPKPDAKITQTTFSLSLSLSRSSLGSKAKAVREERDVIFVRRSNKILKATAFFFFLSFFRGKFSRFFQSDSVRGSSQLISLLFFFSSTDLYSHTQSSIPAKHYRALFACEKER